MVGSLLLDEEAMTHIPVMAEEVLSLLDPREGQCILDCTAGLGGHALAISRRIGPTGRLIGLDRDSGSLQRAKQNLENGPAPFDLIKSDFRDFDHVLKKLDIECVDGMLFDLGISSFQIDDARRGFSLKADGPLDMRMDADGFITAYDLVNSLSEKEIDYILKVYGEERFHHRIARQIVRYREKAPLETTKDLVQLVLRSLPPRYQRQRIHPATRTFQAFRIAVNRELESLDKALEKAPSWLNQGGRICVIAFHSLEDRIVKQKFRGLAQQAEFRLLTKKPLRPGEEETHHNPRARSARLRAIERTS